MPCLRHRSLADIPAACSFKTLMICSSVNLLLRIVRLLSGEQNPNSKLGAFQGSRSIGTKQFCENINNLLIICSGIRTSHILSWCAVSQAPVELMLHGTNEKLFRILVNGL